MDNLTTNSDNGSPSISSCSGLSSDELSENADYSFTSPHIMLGREREIAKVMSAFHRVSSKSKKSEIVLIHGESGTGKSLLSESVRKTVTENDFAYFVSGKFDQNNYSAGPYSAFVSALTDLCDLIHQSKETFQIDLECKDQLALKKLISNLPISAAVAGSDSENGPPFEDSKEFSSWGTAMTVKDLMDDIAHLHDDQDHGLSLQNNTFDRLKTLFKAFLRSVATRRHPVVLVLEDIQYADSGTLEIIKALATDSSSKYLLIMASYRGSEWRGFQPIVSSPDVLRVTEIKLQNLSESKVNEVISGLLKMPETETRDLSRIVNRKTAGNPYHIRQFMDMVSMEGWLKKKDNGKWEWNLQKIQSETNVSEDIASLIEAKILRLVGNVQHVLKLAAMFGFQFDPRYLHEVISSDQTKQQQQQPGEKIVDSTCIDRALEIAKQECLIEESGKRYKFSHDRIQQAILNLFKNETEKAVFHRKIGTLLRQTRCKGENSNDILLAANHLNAALSLPSSNDERTDLANINLKAAKIAAAGSAYTLAGRYLMTGIKSLQSMNAWSARYQLTIDLHMAAAEVSYSKGDHKQCENMVELVIQHAAIDDLKLKGYRILIDCLCSQGRLKEAIETGVQVLNENGEHIPLKPSHSGLAYELIRTKFLLSGLTDRYILSLGRLQDPKRKAVMNIIGSLLAATGFSGSGELMALLCLRLLRYSLRDGLFRESPEGFAVYGVIQSNMGATEIAYRFGKLALTMQRQLGHRDFEARMTFICYGYLSHLRRPLSVSYERNIKGYDVGIETGTNEYALLCALSACTAGFTSGSKPLADIETSLRNIFSQLGVLNQHFLNLIYLPFWQSVLNLMGESDNHLILSGEAMSIKEATQAAMDANNDMALYSIQKYSFIVTTFFCEWQEASCRLKSMEKFKKMRSTVGNHFSVLALEFFIALYNIARAKLTTKQRRKRKLIARTKKIYRGLKKAYQEGVVMCGPIVSILQVELLSTYGTPSKVYEGYRSAIASAHTDQCMHFEAIVNERAGAYVLENIDFDEGMLFYGRAKQLYTEWGALAKADHVGFILGCHSLNQKKIIAGGIPGRIDIPNLLNSQTAETAGS